MGPSPNRALPFAGIEDSFFAAVFLPKGTGYRQLVTYSDALPPPPDNKEQILSGIGVRAVAGSQPVCDVCRPEGYRHPAEGGSPARASSTGAAGSGPWRSRSSYALNWSMIPSTHNFGWAIILVTIAHQLHPLPA